MRILHINSYYASSKFYKDLFDEEINRGIELKVYIPVENSFKNNDFDYGEYALISRSYFKWERAFFHLKHYKILDDVRKRYVLSEFDLCHAHSWFSNGYIAYKLKKIYGLPYVVAIRNTDVNIFFKYMIHLRRVGKKILKNAERVIFISPKYKEFVLNNLLDDKTKRIIIDKVVVLPNGINSFWIKNKFYKEKNYTKKLKILYIGNIDENKNLITTCQAIELLKYDGFEIVYTVVGKINDKKIFNILEGKEYFNYLGILNKEELINIYRDNDIFIMPSRKETFGLVYAEAMSQDLPVIYSKNQGFDGWFLDGLIGFAVDCNNYYDIYAKVKNILKISVHPVNFVDRFRWEDISAEYINIYRKIIGDKNEKYNKEKFKQF